MTEASFLAFYPRFSSFSPGVVLTEYIRQANARFADFGEDAEEARRLYTAHKLTMYAASDPPEGAAARKAELAAYGSARRQEIASKKVGEVSVTYSETSPVSRASANLADLQETVYGLQLLSLLLLYGYAGYVP